MTELSVSSRLRIAVLGAGYIGRAFAAAAVASGHQVWAVRRSPSPATSDGVQWVRGDVAQGSLDGLPDALDAVALTIAPTHGSGGYDDTYPPAARAAVALQARTGARSLLYTSSTGVYGGRDGAWVTEESPRAGAGPTNAALAAAEDVLFDATTSGVTVMRVAGIYGPGRDPRPRMSTAGALPERGAYWTNLAHRNDIVAAMLHILSHRAAPRLLNVSDGSPALASDVARWLCAEAGGDPASLEFGNDAARSRNNQRVSSAALQALGWVPQFATFRDGFLRGMHDVT
jgi:nucleoside-diphosphate-sugar epimerase